MVLVLSSDSQSMVGRQVILFLRFLTWRDGDTSVAATCTKEQIGGINTSPPLGDLTALGERELLNLKLGAPSRTSRRD